MAAGRVFVCSGCAYTISAWDEGDPYYLDAAGEKLYAHHPAPEREWCIGIETPMLCCTCGVECIDDSRTPLTACPSCAAEDLVALWALDGVRCPQCREGTFQEDPNIRMIS